MKLAFYKADMGYWLDWAIAKFDRGVYSHVELVFSESPDGRGEYYCFSSSSRDKGVRFKWIDLDSGKWDVLDLPLGPGFDKAEAFRCAQSLVGRGYDFPGVFGFPLKFCKHDPRRYFCSEVCLTVLQQFGVLTGPKPYQVSPNGLHQMVRRQKDK